MPPSWPHARSRLAADPAEGRGTWTIIPRPRACAIYRVSTAPKVLLEQATGRSSAAIVATKPGPRAERDAIIGRFLPTAY